MNTSEPIKNQEMTHNEFKGMITNLQYTVSKQRPDMMQLDEIKITVSPITWDSIRQSMRDYFVQLNPTNDDRNKNILRYSFAGTLILVQRRND